MFLMLIRICSYKVNLTIFRFQSIREINYTNLYFFLIFSSPESDVG